MQIIYLHKEANTGKVSAGVCLLLTAKAKIGNFNTIHIPKYDNNGTHKAQARKNSTKKKNKLYTWLWITQSTY